MITTGTNQSKSFSDLLRPLRKNNQALPFFSVQFSSSICTVQSDNRGRRFRPHGLHLLWFKLYELAKGFTYMGWQRIPTASFGTFRASHTVSNRAPSFSSKNTIIYPASRLLFFVRITKPKQAESLLLSVEGCILRRIFIKDRKGAARATFFDCKDLADCAADHFYKLI